MIADVTVLYFGGCPSWRTGLERVHAAARQAGVQVRVATRRVETAEDAERLGFTGSPTILIGGRDPFSQPETVPALACRMYPTPGGLAGSPTVDQLVRALEEDVGLVGRGRPGHGGRPRPP
jgi:hypothetical protein